MRFHELEQGNPNRLEFLPRRDRHLIQKIVLAFAITGALLYLFAFVPGFAGHGASPFIFILLLAGLAVYVILRNRQNLDLVMTTEYQNMLFAQGMALGSNFCIFVRRDGSIVYANEGVRKMLRSPNISQSQVLEAVFEVGGVPQEDRVRIRNSIASCTGDRLIFPVTGADGHSTHYILTLEPLARPVGYLLIRGREYRANRAGEGGLLSDTSQEKIAQILDRTPIGNYTTDASGRFEFVNPAFERAIGYESGEILRKNLALADVLHALDGKPISGDAPALRDYNGEALLRGHLGDLIDGLLFQTVIRNSQGKLLGVTGGVVTSSMLEG